MNGCQHKLIEVDLQDERLADEYVSTICKECLESIDEIELKSEVRILNLMRRQAESDIEQLKEKVEKAEAEVERLKGMYVRAFRSGWDHKTVGEFNQWKRAQKEAGG